MTKLGGFTDVTGASPSNGDNHMCPIFILN